MKDWEKINRREKIAEKKHARAVDSKAPTKAFCYTARTDPALYIYVNIDYNMYIIYIYIFNIYIVNYYLTILSHCFRFIEPRSIERDIRITAGP